MRDYTTIDHVPLVLPVALTGPLMGRSVSRAHARAAEGELPLLPGTGHRRVLTAKLEALLGRRLTVEDIRAAGRAIAPERERARNAVARHRAAKARA